MNRSGDRVIGRSGDRNENLTTSTSCAPIALEVQTRNSTSVILSEQESCIAGRRRVEGSRGSVTNKGRVREFFRECLYAVSRCEAFSGSFDSAPISRVKENQSTRS